MAVTPGGEEVNLEIRPTAPHHAAMHSNQKPVDARENSTNKPSTIDWQRAHDLHHECLVHVHVCACDVQECSNSCPIHVAREASNAALSAIDGLQSDIHDSASELHQSLSPTLSKASVTLHPDSEI